MIEIVALVWVHFFADFVMQSREVATNKSKSNAVLLKHVAIYSVFFLPFGFAFAAVNMALHFVTDYISSRATTKAYQAGKMHLFFTIIGADQAVHMTCLFVTFQLMGAPLWG